MIFHQNAPKIGFSVVKGQKGQIVENPITKSFIGTKININVNDKQNIYCHLLG